MWSRAGIFVFSLCTKAWVRQLTLTLHFKTTLIQMWRKIRFLLVIITLLFTCGERKKCSISKYSNMLCSRVEVSSNVFSQRLCTYVTNIVYNSLRFYEGEIDIVLVSCNSAAITCMLSTLQYLEIGLLKIVLPSEIFQWSG